MDNLKFLIDNYGTIVGGCTILFGIITMIVRHYKNAIRSIMLGNHFYSIFGETPAQTIKEVHDAIKSAHNVLEVRQQISERYLKIGIYICDLSGRCIWTNDYLDTIFNRDSRDMDGFGWLQSVHPEDRQRVHATWMYSVSNGIDYNCKYTVCNYEDSISIELNSSAILVYNNSNIKHCYVGFVEILSIKEERCCEKEEAKTIICSNQIKN